MVINEVKDMKVLTSSSVGPLTPTTPPPHLTNRGMERFCMCHKGHNGYYKYVKVTATVCSKNTTLLPLLLYADMNTPGILWVRTRILNERHGKTTLLRNNASI